MFTTKVGKPKSSESWSDVGKPLASETYTKTGKPLVTEVWIKVHLQTAPATPYADIAEADIAIVDNSAVGPGNDKLE